MTESEVNMLLKRFDRLEERHDEHQRQLSTFKADIAVLQVKAGVWGMLGGMIPVVVTMAIYYITKAG